MAGYEITMGCSSGQGKHIPGSEIGPQVFSFPFLMDAPTIEYITNHGSIMFVIRGLPGTGKSSLSTRFKEVYPTAVICSADHFFKDDSSESRTREALAKSHKFCQRKVEEACQNKSHPVVVQNTHKKIWECNQYLEFANKYGYTAIMAITQRVFIADPKVLARTNTKGLDEQYFTGCLTAWQEYIPKYIGWFVSPEDFSKILGESKQALNALLDDGKFCNTLNMFTEGDIWNYFVPEKKVYCIATYCDSGNIKEAEQFYLSEMVQQNYGKCFSLSILGFVVAMSSVLAVVEVTTDMEPLMLKPCSSPPTGDLNDMLQKMEELAINEEKNDSNITAQENDSHPANAEENKLMNINRMSFLVVASKSRRLLWDVREYAKKLFSSIATSDGTIEESQFLEFDDGTRYCRLPHDTWLIFLSKKLSVQSVLTGLYSSGSSVQRPPRRRNFGRQF